MDLRSTGSREETEKLTEKGRGANRRKVVGKQRDVRCKKKKKGVHSGLEQTKIET